MRFEVVVVLIKYKLYKWIKDEHFNWKKRPKVVSGLTLMKNPEELTQDEWNELVNFIFEEYGRGQYEIRQIPGFMTICEINI